MRLDSNPSFRRIIPPWYDADALCYAVIVSMAAVFLFGLLGVSVAVTDFASSGYVWLPLALALLSLWVLVTTSLRLAKRRRWRSQD